uniref:p53 DNA-binding domain-containing protein n=1 Tax=Anopheles dirus TaxID=7168 RepID=A0A3F2YVL6_9DIPT
MSDRFFMDNNLDYCAEIFGEINTGSYPIGDDFQTLYRLDTNDLLPAETVNFPEAMMMLRSSNVAEMHYLKMDEEDTKPKLTGQYVEEMTSMTGHLKKIPILDEMSHPPHNFTVGVSGKSCSASSWCYSQPLDKLFVKKKTAVTFDVSYSRASQGCLKLRIMLVYTNPQDVYKLITRCQDDIAKDRANDYDFKQHVVRCLNPVARYTGREDGVNSEDRLGVLLDLNGVEMMQQTVPVSLEFLCQNSCPSLERRPTSLLFTLENEHGTLLGRKSISVKVCSCPKRDMDKDEKKVPGGRAASASGTKRKHAMDAISTTEQQPPPAKLACQLSIAHATPTLNDTNNKAQETPGQLANATVGQIKREHSFTTLGRSLSNLSNSSNAVDNDSSAVVLTLRLPDISSAADVALYAFKHLSSIFIGCKDEQEKERYARYLKQCGRVKSKYSSSHH